jgi:hypothetical protein
MVFAASALILVALPFAAGSLRIAIALAAGILAGAGMLTAVLLPQLHGFREASARAQSEHARFLAAAENTLDDFYIFDGVPDAAGAIVDFRLATSTPMPSAASASRAKAFTARSSPKCVPS